MYRLFRNLSQNFSEEENFTANDTSTNSNLAPDIMRDIVPIVGYIELAFAVLGTTLNLAAMIWGRRLIGCTQHHNQRALLFMTAADLLYCSVHCPLRFIQYSIPSGSTGPILKDYLCVAMQLSNTIGSIASSLSLLLLNIDKFLYVYKPLHYHLIMTKRRIIGCGLTAWSIAIVGAVLLCFGPATEYALSYCHFKPTLREVYLSFLIVFFVLPVLLSLLTSIFIGFIAKQARQRNALRRLPATKVPSRFRRKTKENLKSIVFIYFTTIWSAMTTLPYRIGYTIHFQSNMDQITQTTVLVMFGLFLLKSLNAVGNPVITLHRQYQVYKTVQGRQSSLKSLVVGTTPKWASEFCDYDVL